MIKCCQFKAIPIPNSIITTLSTWKNGENNGDLVFANRRGIPFTRNCTPDPNLSVMVIKAALFLSIPAKLPGIVIATEEDACVVDITEEE